MPFQNHETAIAEPALKTILKYLLPPLVIVLAIAIVVVLAMNRPEPESREVTTSAMVVDVVEAQASRDHFRISAQGTVRARTQTSIAAEVSGRIVEVSEQFVAGGFFRAGEVLARIDDSDYEAALLQAEADLASARAQLSEEQARSNQARQDWQRMHGSEREPGELVLRLPQVAGAQAAVQAAEAARLRARRDLERTRIRLPFDGLVRSRAIDLGQYVSPGAALGVAFAVDIAEIRLPLSSADMGFLDLPQPGSEASEPVPVRLSGTVAGQRGEWQGQIVRTEGVIDENTRLNYAVARVEDPYGLLEHNRRVPLQMGTFVQAEIHGRSAAGLIELPRSALREGDSVYLANADDELEIRQVDVVRSTPGQVYVHNNIAAGDRVITTAIQAPVPGLKLRVRERDSQPPELRLLPAEQDALAGTGEPVSGEQGDE